MRHALRRLFSTPAFSLTAAITLAAAIGANALIFSIVYGVLLKPLPFADPGTLVGVWHVAPGLMPGPLNQAPSTYFAYREQGNTFEDIGLWDTATVTVTGRGNPEELDAIMVTDATLPLLGVRPVLGRVFSKQDDSPGTPQTVLISHDYWQRAFNSDRGAVGQSITIDGTPREVIGVLPGGFRFLRHDPDMLTPMRFNRAETKIGQFGYQGIARLKPGVTLDAANADLARIIPNLVNMFAMPDGFTRQMFDEIKLAPNVRPLSEDVIGDIGKLLWVLLGTVGVMLLVACANVANLFLVRAEGRQQEIAVRLALGAGRGRIARELLTESLLLGLIGGVFGLALAYAGIQLLLALEPARLPRLDEIAIDPIVMLFTLGISLLAGLLFGLVPVLKYARPQLAMALKENGRGSSDGRDRHRTRNTLVVAQVALALVLLVGSGLMIRTFVAMRDVAPGFTDPARVLTLRVAIPAAVIGDAAQVAQTYEQLVRRIEGIAGVSSVGLTSSITMDGWDSNDPLFADGVSVPDGKLPSLRRFKWIGENYFRTMGNPIVAGRDITWSDIHNRRKVAILSDNLAREFFGTPQAAIGRRVRQSPSNPWREVIGVVGDEHDDGVTKGATSMVYWPILMEGFYDEGVVAQRALAFAIRTERLHDAGFLGEVQRAVWAVNPNLPVAGVETLRELYDESMAQTSFTLVILGIASAVTLLLGVVGIYGVIAYVVVQRRREVGIRMALGAAAGEVQRLFVRHGLIVAGIGLLIGTVAAAAGSRLLSSLLFNVSPLDPVTFGGGIVTLALVALFATWLPARRATQVDPVIALRGD
ncbi:MAG TPA: ABC transporter permease [Vicinamibacterales bacterium]|nr:ABC transporter permease [Vicinamibacterales bacterium]